MDLADHLLTTTYVQDGALFWIRTRRPVDPQVFRLAGVEAPAAQDEVAARYDISIRRGRQDREPVAALGTGTVISFVATRSRR